MAYKFVSNIYDPERPDAATKVLSENYGERCTRRKAGLEDQVDDDGLVIAGKIAPPPSPEKVLEYIKNVYLEGKHLGPPKPPHNSPYTQEELIEMGYKGVYAPETPLHRRSAPSCGTGGGESHYPKQALYGKDGEVIKVISQEHTV